MNSKEWVINVACGITIACLVFGVASEQRTVSRLAWERNRLLLKCEQLGEQAAAAETRLVPDAAGSDPLSSGHPPRAETLRLRGEVALLRREIQEVAKVREENERARTELRTALKDPSAPTEHFWPRASWEFKGFGTPDASFQSSLWAMYNGDVKAFLGGVAAEISERATDDLKEKGESEIAVLLMDEVMSMETVRILDRETRGDDSVLFRFETDGPKGVERDKILLKKQGDIWVIAGRDQE